jgi:raffinose/stachyose/melibiose transport system permease protein
MAKEKEIKTKKKFKPGNLALGAFLTALSVAYIYPIFMVLINSLKVKSAITTSNMFKLPTEETFNGWRNFEVAIKTNGFFKSFGYSAFITVTSVLAICIFCSMCAWFITRVKSKLTSLMYYLFAFSMVVPFQMVMLTLSKTANKVGLDSPWLIWIIYLGFGAGLAVFMFAGFMKSVPLEIEEASMIDGCNPLQTFFRVVFPILKPTMVSVAILEAMWVWNDYLLPYLVLDRTKEYSTLPILVQAAFTGSYGRQEQGPMFASMLLTIIPIIVIYIAGQKHIIKGVAAGAVKG